MSDKIKVKDDLNTNVSSKDKEEETKEQAQGQVQDKEKETDKDKVKKIVEDGIDEDTRNKTNLKRKDLIVHSKSGSSKGFMFYAKLEGTIVKGSKVKVLKGEYPVILVKKKFGSEAVD